MFILLISLLSFVNTISGKSLDVSIRSLCNIPDNRDECLSNFGCMWCNNTGNIFSVQNNTDGYCRDFDICNFNESEYSGCETSKYYSNNECSFLKLLYYSLLLFGFVSATSLLLYTNYKLLAKQNIDESNINRIQGLLVILLLVPFLLLYLYDTIIFYYYLLVMILVSLTYSCCFHTSKHAPNYYRSWSRTQYSMRHPYDPESEKLLN
jgi:hypothetical protein